MFIDGYKNIIFFAENGVYEVYDEVGKLITKCKTKEEAIEIFNKYQKYLTEKNEKRKYLETSFEWD